MVKGWKIVRQEKREEGRGKGGFCIGKVEEQAPL